MKKLLVGIIIIGLPLIVFFQYKNYKRFNPPANYEYTFSDAIDLNYHDAILVDEYFRKGVEIGSFARLKWRNESIDVRFPNQNSEVELNAAKFYDQLQTRVMLVESKLKNSFQLKSNGFSNEEIMHIESGVPMNAVKFQEEKASILNLKIGDRGRLVWELQKRLNSNGYEHQLDGVFGLATQNALTSFQNDNQLYPSGAMDQDVFTAIFLN